MCAHTPRGDRASPAGPAVVQGFVGHYTPRNPADTTPHDIDGDRSLLIRHEEPQDVEAIHAVNASSFPGDVEARLVDALRDGGSLTMSMVAIEDDRIVGHIAFSPVQTESGASGLGLAPVAVLESHRRRGIGAALIRAGLDACRLLDVGWVVVLGEPAYYGRFGFVAASRFGLHDEYGGSDAFQALELCEGALPRGAGLVKYAPEFSMVE